MSQNVTSEEDESMSTTPEIQQPAQQGQQVLNGVDSERFVVRLAVPVDTTDPEAALELVMQDIAYYGLKQYIWLVEHEDSNSQWYVGEQGIMTTDEVDEVAGGWEDPEDVASDANDTLSQDGESQDGESEDGERGVDTVELPEGDVSAEDAADAQAARG